MYKIINLKSGNIAVVSPYNPKLVTECKRRMGRYININLPEGTVQAWSLDPSHREAIEQMLAELFPDKSSLVVRTIKFSTDQSYYSPTIDGYDLVSFGRDTHAVRHFDRGEPIQILEIIETTLETGGSRNNPRLYGSLMIKVKCRQQAIASGNNWEIEEVEK